jgi:predicted ATPase/DNA-binding SARP family transcriptional activator
MAAEGSLSGMGETMRIGLLGPLQVRDPAGREVPVGGRRARTLVIILALDAGRVVPAGSLIGRLWPDDLPGDAGNALQSLVSRLRARFRAAGAHGDVIESAPGGYRLALPPDAVDAFAFESLARQGARALAGGDPGRAAAALDQALGLWRGPALADAADDDLAVRQAARLGELRDTAVLDRIETGLALGEGTSLVGEVRAMVAANPLAERPRALLMRALYADGRQAEALEVYQEGREVLASQLGVDPSPQLEQVYLGVLRKTLADGPRGAPGGGPPSPGPPGSGPSGGGAAVPAAEPRLTNLREPLTSFVGRDTEVRQVVKLLADERLVTLTGPGGVGKTRLATEAAAVLAAGLGGEPGEGAAPGQGGVWFVELAPVTCAADVPYAVLDVLGLRDVGMLGTDRGQAPRDPEPLRRLVSALGRRSALLVLDNCEHVVGAAAAFAGRLLGDCPRLRILATSREPLGVGGERLWSVPPLPVPPGDGAGLTAGEVGTYPAVRLLLDRAAAAQAGQEVTAASAGALSRICRMLDGMPLAIELAAPRLRTLSPAQLAGRLDDRFRLLAGGNRAAMPRHQTLRAVVDWSWELLSEPERILARRLAVFPAGATLNSAEQVCAGSSLPAEEVLPALAGLVDKSFLAAETSGQDPAGDGACGGEPGPAGPEPRYRMLETVRAYALDRLAEAGEEQQVRTAMSRCFLDLAETADRRLRGPGQRHWMNVLIAEQDNLYAAMRWAVRERDAEVALSFGRALAWYWMLRGHRSESVALAREAMSVPLPWAEAGIPPDIADARVVCALCELMITGMDWDLEESRQVLADALAVADRVARPPGHGRDPLVAMAPPVLALTGGDIERALGQLAALSGAADPWLRAVARVTYANMSMASGRPEEAARHCDVALEEFRRLGDAWGQAMALFSRSETCALRGDHAASIRALEDAAAIVGLLSDSIDLAHIHLHLARQRAHAGDMAESRAELDRGLRMAGAQGDDDFALWAQLVRFEAGWLEGRLAEAEALGKWLDGEMARRASIFWQPQRGVVRARLALLTLAHGDTDGAAVLLGEALDLAGVTFERPPLAAVIDSVAVFALRRPAGDDGPGGPGGPGAAELAATLLGAGHAIRGAFDHGSLDAPAAREEARRALGDGGFGAAYERGRALGCDEAVALAGQVLRR